MEIRICSYLSASLLLEREPMQWHALVMIDSDKEPTDFVKRHTQSHLFLHYDDVEEPPGRKRLPTFRQIRQGLAFAAGKDQLVVCCRAGRGRSVAMAYSIACQEQGVDDALRLLDPTRHRPNRLVISIGGSVLGDPGVLARFDEWRSRHAHVNLADYYDEVEAEVDALVAQGARNRIAM